MVVLKQSDINRQNSPTWIACNDDSRADIGEVCLPLNMVENSQRILGIGHGKKQNLILLLSSGSLLFKEKK